MKIVVLDGYTENPGDLSWDALKELGEVEVYDRTSYEESPLICRAYRGCRDRSDQQNTCFQRNNG